MHGGAEGSGAPKGNSNAYKHGGYTSAVMARRAELRRMIRIARELVKESE
jgi:hypothetical protein